MILKLIRGDYFRGAINYVTRAGEYAGQDEARILRLEGIFNLRTATAQLVQQASLAPDRTKRVAHLLGRAEKSLTDAQYEETIRRCLETLGLQGRPYVSVIHDDDGHFHVVTVEQDEHGKAPPRRLYSRLLKRDVTAAEAAAQPKGDVVSRSWDSHACWRLSKVAREIEVEFGLRRLRTGVTSDGPEEAGERIKIPSWQFQRENEQGLAPLALAFADEIKAALKLPGWDERAAALEIYGLAMRPYQGSNKRREGIQIYAIGNHDHCCNGSDLGKNYGLGALNKRGAVSLQEWFSQRLEPTVQGAREPTPKNSPIERARLRSEYELYAAEHRQRRAARKQVNADHLRRRRDIRRAVKAARPALLRSGLPKTEARSFCRVMRQALVRRSEAEYLEKVASLARYRTRKSTWSEWLLERAGGDPAARSAYDDMRRRLSKEERDAALLAAATAKAQREAEAKRIADEASRTALAAKASEAKLARIEPIAAKGPLMWRPSASASRPVAGVDTPVTSLKIPTGAAQPTRAEPSHSSVKQPRATVPQKQPTVQERPPASSIREIQAPTPIVASLPPAAQHREIPPVKQAAEDPIVAIPPIEAKRPPISDQVETVAPATVAPRDPVAIPREPVTVVNSTPPPQPISPAPSLGPAVEDVVVSGGELPEPPHPAPPSHEEWEAVIVEIEEFYRVVFDPEIGRYDVLELAPDLRAVVFSAAHDEATQEKLASLLEPVEVAHALLLLAAAQTKPDLIVFDGDAVAFPGYEPDDRQLLERHKAHPEVASFLEPLRKAHEAAEILHLQTQQLAMDRSQGR